MSDDKKSDFDKFVDELQEQIYEQERQDFSEKVVAEYYNPYHFGKMKNPSAFGEAKGKCGMMQFFLKINNKIITDATFFTDGCGTTVACGSKMIKLIEKKSIKEIIKITENDLKNALDGLPPENEHCAELAVRTLRVALKNYK